jgi:hypothetical protein
MRTILLGLFALLAFEAQACGICIDDKIASSYDHALIMQAKAAGRAVAFFGIEGDIVRSAATRRAVMQAIEATPGVQRGSARVSLENAALSFVFDPARTSPEAAQRALDRRLAAKGLGVSLLRTI